MNSPRRKSTPNAHVARVASARRALEQRLLRRPTHRELAAWLQVDVATYHRWCQEAAAYRTIRAEGRRAARVRAETMSDVGADPYAQLCRAQRARELDEALERLPEREQTVLRLRLLDGLDLREVCATLGWSEGFVCHLQRQGAVRLAKRLHRHGARVPHAS
jgi:DNA-directed RNA polymerase specialized sigma subunit